MTAPDDIAAIRNGIEFVLSREPSAEMYERMHDAHAALERLENAAKIGVSPLDVDEQREWIQCVKNARCAALEEAAKIADWFGDSYVTYWDDPSAGIAARIRALADKENDR